jgi:hypothetical protein
MCDDFRPTGNRYAPEYHRAPRAVAVDIIPPADARKGRNGCVGEHPEVAGSGDFHVFLLALDEGDGVAITLDQRGVVCHLELFLFGTLVRFQKEVEAKPLGGLHGDEFLPGKGFDNGTLMDELDRIGDGDCRNNSIRAPEHGLYDIVDNAGGDKGPCAVMDHDVTAAARECGKPSEDRILSAKAAGHCQPGESRVIEFGTLPGQSMAVVKLIVRKNEDEPLHKWNA